MKKNNKTDELIYKDGRGGIIGGGTLLLIVTARLNNVWRVKWMCFFTLDRKGTFENKIKDVKEKKEYADFLEVGWRGRKGQDETNDTKTFRIQIKAGSVFLRSSTAHHHPDEFCRERGEEKTQRQH